MGVAGWRHKGCSLFSNQNVNGAFSRSSTCSRGLREDPGEGSAPTALMPDVFENSTWQLVRGPS